MIINSRTLDDFRRDFEEAVKTLNEKYGVQVSMKGITYDSDSFSFKVEVKNGGSAEEVKRNDFIKNCSRYFMTPEDLNNLTFIYKGKTYMVSGINPGKTKFGILAKENTGKEYGFTLEAIPELLDRQSRYYRNLHNSIN